jgi:hypothetical protein
MVPMVFNTPQSRKVSGREQVFAQFDPTQITPTTIYSQMSANNPSMFSSPVAYQLSQTHFTPLQTPSPARYAMPIQDPQFARQPFHVPPETAFLARLENQHRMAPVR